MKRDRFFMICVPIVGASMLKALDQITAAEKLADFLELRLDLIDSFDLSLLLNAANKPVIVTDVGGLSEIVNEGKPGYVIQSDAGSIANGILQFYNDYERVNFTDKIKSYKQRFTWHEFIHQLENIIS